MELTNMPASNSSKLFISHSSKDDTFVRELRMALADHGQEGWIDSRELRGGNPLWPEIRKAIEEASAFAIIVSPDALQSNWVGKELNHALKVQKERGKHEFPVIPLSLDGTKLGVLEEFFDEEPIYISMSSGPGGVEAAVNPILVALEIRKPTDIPTMPQPKAEPVEELVLELTDLKFHGHDGVRRASAHARLVYEPAKSGRPHVHSVSAWRFIAPIGPIEAEELRWYLEQYAVWPSHYFRDRARKLEENLVRWGRLLHEAAIPAAHTSKVISAWEKASDHAGRRFSVHVDTALEAGAVDSDVRTAREAATLLLGLPWELLHDGTSYIFQGAKPVRVRRRLPSTEAREVPVVATPIRILLVTARPEDESCGYIDHRASALPLVEAMEALPGQVKLHVLNPSTLPALREELDRARNAREPYHVIHFDGHGVYDKTVGLGGLCFELLEDSDKLDKRRHVTVFTSELGPLLRDHRIPLVFLEACQTAQAEKASESVASELLKVGVASVVAMSHSVLVKTASLFVGAFYQALAADKRVGDAMLAGQRQLKDDTFRGRIFGAGELRLEDWFVPVLFQEKEDPQLFTKTPARQTVEDFKAALTVRMGELPPEPETGFVGRSRELLALQRLLRRERYAVVRGQGGEGKSALAAEFARWMVRSQQMHRAAFVSLETHSNQRAVLDVLGKQLVSKKFSAAGDLEEAIQEVERALREQVTLLVVDNMESILLPPYVEKETPEALSEEMREEMKAILALCERLLKQGDTHLIFTSREALPEPFEAERHRRELHQLDREDAVKLVERVLNTADGDAGTSADAARDEIEQLVNAVHCHARTLALLAPALQGRGVEATRESLMELMAEMERRFPGSREKSVFASVELSLRRLGEVDRERARTLGVFNGGVNSVVLATMMSWKNEDAAVLMDGLVQVGLASPNSYGHFTLNPALCPYLRRRVAGAELNALMIKWVEAMSQYVSSLETLRSRAAQIVATLVPLELPNFFALLDSVQSLRNAEATIELAASLNSLVSPLGKSRLLERIGQLSNSAEREISDTWTHALFQAKRTRIEQQVIQGQLNKAQQSARDLLRRARMAGEQAYPTADFDLAMAYILLARVLKKCGGAEQALPLLGEALSRYEALESQTHEKWAAGMLSACKTEKGDCLRHLGRLEEAAAAYHEAIDLDTQRRAYRDVAVGQAQLGSVRFLQQRYAEAMNAYQEALKQFTRLNEPRMIASCWHQMGMAYQAAGQPAVAEDAYHKALEIKVSLNDPALEASTLAQLGDLYYSSLGRHEEGLVFDRQAADKYLECGDTAKEGMTRTNLGLHLFELRRLDEARQEIHRAINCQAQFGHVVEPWKSWDVLADIERCAGDLATSEEAKTKAIACYLAYRRDGGENQGPDGRIVLGVVQSLLNGDTATAESILQELGTDRDLNAGVRAFKYALQAIIAGSRDRALANSPELSYSMAVEIIIALEIMDGVK
jgi:tetratricopeptide (TPR) repeat protein